MHCDVCNFADDTTPYVCGNNLDFVFTELEEHSMIAFEWFGNSYTKMNSYKCHLFILGNKFENWWTKIDRENRTVKLLGITIDSELKFNEHLSNVCLKANRKLSTLMRIRKYLDIKKIRILFKGFFEAQFKFKYYPPYMEFL